MPIFNVTDSTTGRTKHTNGTQTQAHYQIENTLNDSASSDSYQISATSSDTVDIVTGSGNDAINAGATSGPITFIDAGSGTNTITGGAGLTDFIMDVSATPTWTQDIISNFHASDVLTFNGATAMMEFVRGANLMITAWNPAIAGSAINATLMNFAPSGITSLIHNPDSVVLQA